MTTRRPSRPVLVLADPPTEARWRCLEGTLRTLLTPMDHASWESWRAMVHAQFLELTGAHAVLLHVPLGADPAAAWVAPHLEPEVSWRVLAAPGAMAGRDIERLLGATGDDVADEDALLAAGLADSALARELLAPHGLHGITAARVDFGAPAPALVLLADRARRSDETRRERVTLLRTVLPAFGAGLAAWRRAQARRAGVARMLDAMTGAAMLYDASGERLHANLDAGALGGVDGERVRGEAQQLAWTMAATARRARAATGRRVSGAFGAAQLEREVRGQGRVWHLKAVVAPSALLEQEIGILVTIAEADASRPLTDDQLARRHGLTAREVEVARLLGEGLSNSELAARLGVSFFTARNHVERVLGKLGVQGRARVAALLQGAAAG